MKYRCMCAKPELIVLAQIGQFANLRPTNNSDLHFKAADWFCSVCGRPLCKKCASDYKVGIRDNKFTTFEYICPICVEIKEKPLA